MEKRSLLKRLHALSDRDGMEWFAFTVATMAALRLICGAPPKSHKAMWSL